MDICFFYFIIIFLSWISMAFVKKKKKKKKDIYKKSSGWISHQSPGLGLCAGRPALYAFTAPRTPPGPCLCEGGRSCQATRDEWDNYFLTPYLLLTVLLACFFDSKRWFLLYLAPLIANLVTFSANTKNLKSNAFNLCITVFCYLFKKVGV